MRNFITCVLSQIWGGVGWEYSTNGSEEVGKPKGRHHCKDLDVDVRIMDPRGIG
jgi:hypothetical protein